MSPPVRTGRQGPGMNGAHPWSNGFIQKGDRMVLPLDWGTWGQHPCLRVQGVQPSPVQVQAAYALTHGFIQKGGRVALPLGRGSQAKRRCGPLNGSMP